MRCADAASRSPAEGFLRAESVDLGEDVGAMSDIVAVERSRAGFQAAQIACLAPLP